jgi:hypothetical protein
MLRRIATLSGLLLPIRAGLAAVRVNQRTSLEEYNSHFEQKMPVIDRECGEIIREMGKERPNIARLNSLFEDYLEFTKFGNFVPRTLKGLLSVMSAIGMSGCEPLARYRWQLLEQTNRVQLEGERLE